MRELPPNPEPLQSVLFRSLCQIATRSTCNPISKRYSRHMDNAAKQVYAFEGADGYRVATEPVSRTPEEALVEWVVDASLEPLEMTLATVRVSALRKVPGPVRGEWAVAADTCVRQVMEDFSDRFNDTDHLNFPKFYAVRRIITEALDDLTRDMPVTAYEDEPIATREYSREQVAEILRRAGIWK